MRETLYGILLPTSKTGILSIGIWKTGGFGGFLSHGGPQVVMQVIGHSCWETNGEMWCPNLERQLFDAI